MMVNICHRFMILSCLYMIAVPAHAEDHTYPSAAPSTTSPGLAAAADRFWREVDCLARNIYWEALSDGLESQRAVAAVTLNRVAAPGFPKTICDVVNQGAPRRGLHRLTTRNGAIIPCQFSWRCDSRAHREPKDAAAWSQALTVALDAIISPDDDATDGALFFHAVYVRPGWFESRDYVGQIGGHRYYR
jgi:spore germination cell wall hydrolase CwlJ-like protein